MFSSDGPNCLLCALGFTAAPRSWRSSLPRYAQDAQRRQNITNVKSMLALWSISTTVLSSSEFVVNCRGTNVKCAPFALSVYQAQGFWACAQSPLRTKIWTCLFAFGVFQACPSGPFCLGQVCTDNVPLVPVVSFLIGIELDPYECGHSCDAGNATVSVRGLSRQVASCSQSCNLNVSSEREPGVSRDGRDAFTSNMLPSALDFPQRRLAMFPLCLQSCFVHVSVSRELVVQTGNVW